MSKRLEVGMRVRKVASRINAAPEDRWIPMGCEGTIDTLTPQFFPGEIGVVFDGVGTTAVMPYMIEPIPDDSRQLTTWAEIKSEDGRVIWQPWRVNERA